VAVVGGAGFLGSHVVEHLIRDRDCEVLVIDNLISGRREYVHQDAAFEHADITVSESYLLRLFRQYETEYVFNYAAEPYIPVSFERPLHVFAANATGAMHVIQAAHEAGCRGILQISSAEIYGGPDAPTGPAGSGPPRRMLIDEDYPVSPHSSYGAAKAAIDAMVQVRWREAGTPAIALRQFNCVGERETHPYVVPEIISQIARIQRDGLGNAPVRLGNDSQRDFLYAGDQARMAVDLLEFGDFGEVYNLGSGKAIGIYALALLVGEVMGCEVWVEPDESRRRPWEIWHLKSDNGKIFRTIPARPQVSLEEALARTIAWYRAEGGRWCWE
jgi:nucleoside-diphosphate-sugar epimerase